MRFWLNFLPLIIYILLICLLVIGIILGIKTIITMSKVEKVVDNINDKVESLNSVFNIIDFATSKISGFTDRVVDVISNVFNRLTHKNKKEENIYEEE